MSGPLAGLKVLDIATVLAAPFAATLLSDWGAEVLKVELPGAGDHMRGFPPFKDDICIWWKATQRNKQMITLDLRTGEGAAILKKLLPEYDVLVENFRPGTLDRWGLSKEVLWDINPKLVILRITGFGQDGPYSTRPGFARIFEAMGGLTHITGHKDGQPIHPSMPIGDYLGGLFGAAGALAALWPRAKDPTLPGEEIDLSMTECIIRMLDFMPGVYQQTGIIPGRDGNTSPYSAPADTYRTKDDKWVTMAGSSNALFAANCRAIEREDMISDPRYATNPARVNHREETNKVFADWCAERTQQDVLDAFVAAGGTIAPIYSTDQVVTDPQVVARKAIVSVPDPDFGTLDMPNVVPRFARDPGEVRFTGRDMGADNDLIFRGKLGMDDATIERLRREKVIS